MRTSGRFLVFLICFAFAALAHATIFGNIRGIIHDPQHQPIADASVKLKSATSDWSQSTRTNSAGAFTFAAVPIGDYVLTVGHPGFDFSQQPLTVISGSSPILHFQLTVAAVSEAATVSAGSQVATTDSATPTTLLDRQDIQLTPGADRTNSLEMITDYVPGSYVTHDQLHIRGGHQVSWLVDGVPVPNTNIASNVGPQFDPKDIDYLEVQRGGYTAEYGDRTYGVFNVVPRSGFERNNDAELVASFGSLYQSNDQASLGGHTEKFAYFVSANGNRSDLGLQTPVAQIVHDDENGYGAFASLISNPDPKDQLRLVTSLRRDYYQIPYDPNDPSSNGLRDGELEGDAFVNLSWVRTIGTSMLLTVSPFYHYNSADYESSPTDFPDATTDARRSNYVGLQGTFSASIDRNDVQLGVYGFGQHDNQVFGAVFNDGSSPAFRDRETTNGSLIEEFLEDKFKVASWLTLMAGVRESHFSAGITENATSPRFGLALLIPHLNWVVRGFYGRFYQAPPLLTASGPLLQFVNSQNLAFIPLHGERDEEHDFGVVIPYKGWALESNSFKTRAQNFFDHNNVGESNIFFPVTFDGALIRGWEVTLRSPRLWDRDEVHLAYSNQIAEARGAVTGGLICSPPTSCPSSPDYSPVDHDQRNTLNAGFDAKLPWQAFASGNVYYGSGFTNGSPSPQYPGDYLPGHTTVDLSVGKAFGENYTVAVTALNVTNKHLLIDNSLTFGGFHYNDPREIYVQFRYRFH